MSFDLKKEEPPFPLRQSQDPNRVRVRLYFGYDGANFHGWQRQANSQMTIQQVVELALARVCAVQVNCVASGRTDSGVHARVQVAHAEIPKARAHLVPDGRFVLALNSNLPSAVRLYRAELVDRKFHAQKGVVKKTYLYFADPSPVQQPWLRDRVWHMRRPLDWTTMERAVKCLKGTHDFRAFCDADASTKTFTRTLYEAQLGEITVNGFGSARLKVLRLTGNGFLKHMVRSIMGTLVTVGTGRLTPEGFKAALDQGNRAATGPTAPPQGLWLWDILYLT